jgi:hypothetical protein
MFIWYWLKNNETFLTIVYRVFVILMLLLIYKNTIQSSDYASDAYSEAKDISNNVYQLNELIESLLNKY